ncbi:MAG: ABC transporter ATP-binding protein/permease [Eubacteriaceae bacterium]|nr:ABC transporter ATP-binding protein/permease [Eubacteriaceae bacterium]
MFKLLSRAKPYVAQMSIAIVLLFAIAMLNLRLPKMMASIINIGIGNNDNAYIQKTGLMMILISLCSVACQICANYLTSFSATGFGRDLRIETFKKITYYSIEQVDEFGTAALITRTASDVREMERLLQAGLNSVVGMPLNMIGGIIMALSVDTSLAWVIIVAMPLLLTIIFISIKWVRPLFTAMREKLDNVSRVLRENLSGVRVIRAFNTIEKEHARFNAVNLDYTGSNRQARHRMALVNPLATIITSGTTVAVYWFGQFRIQSGALSAGDIMAFSQYVMQILFSVIRLQQIFNLIPSAMSAADRLNKVLESEPSIVDIEEPLTPLPGIVGRVAFNNVSFHYPGAENPVLKDISFEALPGQTTAIIGGTGSGKSTLVSLIPRLYDVQQGSIEVDGVDITKMSQSDLRSRIGFVTQKAQLFTGSIADNIAFGVAAASDSDIEFAANIAQAHDFISAMENGYDSFVSQDATNLSGGQKQRLSIARVVAKRPEIYVFDDSFSAVDLKTDAALRAALKKVTTNSAVIIVAQRVSTIMDAEQIIVLDEGKCVGKGTHDELMGTCSVYKEIVDSQIKREEAA